MRRSDFDRGTGSPGASVDPRGAAEPDPGLAQPAPPPAATPEDAPFSTAGLFAGLEAAAATAAPADPDLLAPPRLSAPDGMAVSPADGPEGQPAGGPVTTANHLPLAVFAARPEIAIVTIGDKARRG